MSLTIKMCSSNGNKVSSPLQVSSKKCEKQNSKNSTENKLLLIFTAISEFFASTVISMQAPFFPDVARQKGSTATEYGFVFGVFGMTFFIMSLFCGAYMGRFGPKRVYTYGLMASGICCIIFGLMDDINSRAIFITFCFILRIGEGVGTAAFETASFTIISSRFPHALGSNLAILETTYGLGLIAGPTVGGFLYQFGGYKLPFLLMGGILCFFGVLSNIILPEIAEGNDNKKARGAKDMFKLLKRVVILITAFGIVGASAGQGFLSANLDHHVEEYQLSKLVVGSIFILNAGVYAISSPVIGWICDRTRMPRVIICGGAVVTIVGFGLMGPLPFLPFEKSLITICAGLALVGLGIAAALIPAFVQLLADAIETGYPDDISTYGLVSGLWLSMTAFGQFVGPSIGGFLDDMVGFSWASLFIIGEQLILIIILLGLYLSQTIHQKPETSSAQDKKENLQGEIETQF